jgi:predicted nucleic acid-binding protein
MAFEPPIAVLDACVLYPFHLRNVLVQAAVDGLIKARWTDEIHNEWMRNLAAVVPMEHLLTTRRLMEAALPSSSVTGYQRHMDGIDLPDVDDRHVVAAAIESGAAVIVTWNVRDFPESELAESGLRCQNPDDFLVKLHDQARNLLLRSLANARRNLSRTELSRADFLDALTAQRLTRLVERVAPWVNRL